MTVPIGALLSEFKYGVNLDKLLEYRQHLRVLLMTEIYASTPDSPSIPEMDLKATYYILFVCQYFTPHLMTEYARKLGIKYKFGNALLLEHNEVFHIGFTMGTYLHEKELRDTGKGQPKGD